MDGIAVGSCGAVQYCGRISVTGCWRCCYSFVVLAKSDIL